MKYRVLKGAAPEIYGKDVKEGDEISLTKWQAEHLILKGQVAPVEVKGEEPAPPAETPAPTELAKPVTVPSDGATKPKASANGNRG